MGLIKKKIHTMFHDPSTRLFVVVNDFLAVLTIASVMALILETVSSFAPYHSLLLAVEYIAVFFFTLEYMGRIFVSERRKYYIFGFFGIVDLLAILPTILLLTNLTFLKTARILHIVRFLRMLRLVKLVHTKEDPHGKIDRYSKLRNLDIQIYIFAFFSATVIFGTLMYIFEGGHQSAENIPLAMLWVAKVIVGGVAQSAPATILGDITIILTRFTGLLLFGLLIYVVGSSVNKFLFGTPVPEEIQK